MDTNLLTNLGFSEKSAKIYLAALALGTASVQDIAKRAELKRPTTYLHIADMVREGLLSPVVVGKKEYYQAITPTQLEDRAKQQLANVQRAMPELETLKATNLGRPDVTVLEGEKGLERIYDEICQANSIRFWSNLAGFEQMFGDYFTKISSSIRENEITTREIITNTPEARRSAHDYAEAAGRTYSARVATNSPIPNDNAIYGNVIALFRIEAHNLFVVRIEDATLAESLKTIFDLAWEQATPLSGVRRGRKPKNTAEPRPPVTPAQTETQQSNNPPSDSSQVGSGSNWE